MKVKFSKRVLSVFLAVMTLASSLPFAALTAQADITWTSVASTDFSQITWNSASSGDKRLQSVNSATDCPVVNAGDNNIKWAGYCYKDAFSSATSGGVGPDGVAYGSGTYVKDGFLYLENYNGSGKGTPITGAGAFKIDLAFSMPANSSQVDFSIADNDNNHCFLELSVRDTDIDGARMWNDSFFAQNMNGKCYSIDSTGENDTCFGNAAAKYNLSLGRTTTYTVGQGASTPVYHYILEYANNVINAYVADNNGKVVLNYGSYYSANFDTSRISGLKLGDDDDNYYAKAMNYKSITFYTGTVNATVKNNVSSNYLFAYFTGDEAGQRIRFAVSDDGINYTALKGNAPFLVSNYAIDQIDTYTFNNRTHNNFTHSAGARDPFIIQKRDSSGNVIPGQYFVIATDLYVYDNSHYNNSRILVWDINDLNTAGSVVPWDIETTGMYNTNYANNNDYIAWAPEAMYDPEVNAYMMFWSGPLYNSAQIRYAYTRDFKSFFVMKNGVETPINGSDGDHEPGVLYDISGTNTIDGTMAYEDGYYYLIFKNESAGQIYIVRSKTPTGFRYQKSNKLYDSAYTGTTSSGGNGQALEGPEVFQLADGKWIVLADNYTANPKCKFLMYEYNNLADLMNSSIDKKDSKIPTNINDLFPRHGAVVHISQSEYETLMANHYDEVNYDKMQLIARYFTTDEVTEDATGHNFSATNIPYIDSEGNERRMQMVDKDGRKAAFFDNYHVQTTDADKIFAYTDTNQMFDKYAITASDKLIFTWESYDLGNQSYKSGGLFGGGSWNDNHYYNLVNLIDANTPVGSLTNPENNNYATYSHKYVYLNGCMGTGISSGQSGRIFGNQAFPKTVNSSEFLNRWCSYTMIIDTSGVSVYRDGEPYCSVDTWGIDDNWFKTLLQNGRINFGVSLFGDPMFNGYISDFRIYSRVQKAIPVEDNKPFYFDPMENTTVDGVEKTAYTGTVSDPVHNDVLKYDNEITGTSGVLGHNGNDSTQTVGSRTTYKGTGTDPEQGYTISFWYNPGATANEGAIFSIGRPNSVDNNAKHYFELLENGDFYFNWQDASGQHYFDIKNGNNVFGSEGLAANKWSFITIQVVSKIAYDAIVFYVNGIQTYVLNTNNWANVIEHNADISYADNTVHSYLAQDHEIRFGSGCGYWNTTSDGYIDNFAIYNNVYTADSIYASETYTIAEAMLQANFAEYDSKMDAIANGTVYSNLYNATNSIDNAKRYLDSVKYGGVEMDLNKVAELNLNASNALAGMRVFNGPVTVQGYSKGGTYVDTNNTFTRTAIDAKFTQNMLTVPDYIYDESGYEKGFTQDQDYHAFRICSSEFVWLYDGVNTPTAPYMCSNVMINASGAVSQYKAQCVYINNSAATNYMALGGLNLWSDDTYWHQRTGYLDSYSSSNTGNAYKADWFTTYKSSDWSQAHYYQAKFPTTNKTDEASDANMKDNNGNWYYANTYARLTVNSSNESTFFGNSYMASITPEWAEKTYFYSSKISKGTCGKCPHKVSNGSIKVINYAPAKRLIENANNVAAYKNADNYIVNADLTNLLQGYDKITGANYQVTYGGADSLATTIGQGVESLQSVNLSNLQERADHTALAALMETEQPFHDTTDNSPYTPASWDAYDTAYDTVTAYYASLNPYGDNQQYSTNSTQLSGYASALSTAHSNITKKADFAALETAIAEKADNYSDLTDNVNYDGYTATSLVTFYDAYTNAVAKDNIATYAPVTEKYNVEGYTKGPDSETLNANQTGINDATDALRAAFLTPVDTQSAYDNFEAAVNVLLNSNLEKYHPTVRETIKNAIVNSVNTVYATDQDIVDRYNEICYSECVIPTVQVDSTSFDDSLLAKDAGIDAVDEQTAYLLSLINAYNLDDESLTKVTAYLTLDGVVGDAQVKKYGEYFNFSVNTDEGDIVLWSVTRYSGIGKESGAVTGTPIQKAIKYTTNDSSLTLKADTDVSVIATIIKNQTSEDFKTRMVNIFGKVEKEFGSNVAPTIDNGQLKVGTETIVAPKVAFYDFDRWVLTNDGNYYTAKALYVPSSDFNMLNITIEGSDDVSAKFHQKVTMTTDDPDFYAWAVDKDGMYQLVSYVKDYRFSAVCDEDYVIVRKDTAEGNYYVGELGESSYVQLLPENVDGFYNPTGKGDEDFLNALLTNKIGFATIQKAEDATSEYNVAGRTSIRAYARITVGYLKVSEFGMTLNKGSNSTLTVIDQVNAGGQYSAVYHIGSDKNPADYTFKAYSVAEFFYTPDPDKIPGADINTTLKSVAAHV